MISRLEKNPLVPWFFVIILAVAIFWVSSWEKPYVQITNQNIDAIIYHLSAFFFLGFFLLIALVKGKNKNLFVLGIVLAILYAVSDESHQFFVPGRCMCLSDIFIDTTGIIFAAMIYFILLERRKVFKIPAR